MSKDPSDYPQNEKEVLQKLFEELSDEDLDFEKLSTDSNRSESNEITVTNFETEHVLDSLKSKLGHAKDEAPADKQHEASDKSNVWRNFRYYLAAAVILIATGIGYMVVPVTHSVPYGETATIQLPDGSNIVMNSGTEIQYNRLFGKTNRHLQFNGEAFFEVEPSDNVFIVEANGAVVEVTGTEFNVRSWRNDPGSAAQVTVASGTVRFYPAANKSAGVELTQGLSSRWYPDDRSPTDPDEVDLDDVTAWKENNLSFIGQPLRLIFNEIERKFNVNIEIQDEKTGNEVLTTFYTGPQNAETLLDDITTVKGLNYRETANGYIVFNEN
ncbi:MAG: FecR domain-containing protein [Balneolaceae bacterium]|nr:FecR domain-containing protein [Balneolaceae bacterium]